MRMPRSPSRSIVPAAFAMVVVIDTVPFTRTREILSVRTAPIFNNARAPSPSGRLVPSCRMRLPRFTRYLSRPRWTIVTRWCTIFLPTFSCRESDNRDLLVTEAEQRVVRMERPTVRLDRVLDVFAHGREIELVV